MTEAILEKTICEKCGVDVRENTLFCYNCGASVAAEPVTDSISDLEQPENEDDPDPTGSALKDLEDRFKVDEAEDDRLAKAAAERRKARVKQHKNVRYVWEPKSDDGNRTFVLLSVLIAVVAAAAVFLGVYWK